ADHRWMNRAVIALARSGQLHGGALLASRQVSRVEGPVVTHDAMDDPIGVRPRDHVVGRQRTRVRIEGLVSELADDRDVTSGRRWRGCWGWRWRRSGAGATAATCG